MFVRNKVSELPECTQKDKNDNGPSITIAYLVNHVSLTNRNYEQELTILISTMTGCWPLYTFYVGKITLCKK